MAELERMDHAERLGDLEILGRQSPRGGVASQGSGGDRDRILPSELLVPLIKRVDQNGRPFKFENF